MPSSFHYSKSISNSIVITILASYQLVVSAAMEFVREPPVVSLAAPHNSGRHTYFAADIYTPRLHYDEIFQAKEWYANVQTQFEATLAKARCNVEWVGIFMDAEGCWLLAIHKTDDTLNNMKKALRPVLLILPMGQKTAVENSIRALDELDADRIAAWVRLEDLRPKVRPTPERPPITVAEFLESWDGYDREANEEEEVAEATVGIIMLSGPISMDEYTLSINGSRAGWTEWKARAQEAATIVAASAGLPPDSSRDLHYDRCRSAGRRHLLLVRRFRGEKTLANVMGFAAKMAAEGSIPGPVGARCRKTEFIQRCVDALKYLNPDAETDITKLNTLDRYAVQVALGERDELYQGCMNEECLGQDTTWKVTDLSLPGESPMPYSKCTRCGNPKAYGRKYTDKDMPHGIMFSERLMRAERAVLARGMMG
jgi:ribosomal protein S14